MVFAQRAIDFKTGLPNLIRFGLEAFGDAGELGAEGFDRRGIHFHSVPLYRIQSRLRRGDMSLKQSSYPLEIVERPLQRYHCSR